MTNSEAATIALLNILPRHEAGLSIEHNPHLVFYDSAEDYVTNADFNWTSDEAKEKAIAANDFWIATWYPDTPVGSLAVASDTLAGLLAELEEYTNLSDQ